MKLMEEVSRLLLQKKKCNRISNIKSINKLKNDEIKINKNSFQNFEKELNCQKKISTHL